MRTRFGGLVKIRYQEHDSKIKSVEIRYKRHYDKIKSVTGLRSTNTIQNNFH